MATAGYIRNTALGVHDLGHNATLRQGLSLAGIFLILVGSMLLAIQLRYQITFGATLNPEYIPFPLAQPFVFLVSISLVTLATYYLPPVLSRSKQWLNTHVMSRYLLTVLLCVFLTLLLLPDVSQLQVAYFTLIAVASGLIGVALPNRLYPASQNKNVILDLQQVYERRALIGLWLSSNVRSRYSQTVLGILWIVLLPLLTSVVLAIAFTQFLRVELDVPIISFFLAGLVPYNIFNMGVLNSTGAVVNRLSLIGQVYFPREIVVLLVLGEVLVDFIFTFTAMLVINLVFGIVPNIYFVYLPLLIALLVVLALGFMFIASSISVFIRDIPQLISVVMQLLFYITPIIYPVDLLPAQLKWLFYLNPVSALVQGFRDVIVYARPPDMGTLVYPALVGGIFLYAGYCVFKSIEANMADMI